MFHQPVRFKYHATIDFTNCCGLTCMVQIIQIIQHCHSLSLAPVNPDVLACVCVRASD